MTLLLLTFTATGIFLDVGANSNNYFQRTVDFFTQSFCPQGWGIQPGIQKHPTYFVEEWLLPFSQHLEFMMLMNTADASPTARA